MNLVDFYSGIGGGTLGFLYAGYPAVYACETDDKACLTYLSNFLVTIKNDIRQAQPAEIKHPEVVFASPPPDYMLMSHMMKLIGEIKPRAVLLEFGIRNLKKGAVGVIERALSAIGYRSWNEVLSANDYGLPHKRRSIYFVAFRHDVQSIFSYFPFPEPPSGPKATLANILDENPNEQLMVSKQRLDSIVKENATNKAAGLNFRHRIYTPGEAITCLPLGYYKDYRSVLVDAGQGPRRLSMAECRRLMGFPDNFIFPVSETHAYRLLAAASCPPMIEVIAQEIDDWIRY